MKLALFGQAPEYKAQRHWISTVSSSEIRKYFNVALMGPLCPVKNGLVLLEVGTGQFQYTSGLIEASNTLSSDLPWSKLPRGRANNRGLPLDTYQVWLRNWRMAGEK